MFFFVMRHGSCYLFPVNYIFHNRCLQNFLGTLAIHGDVNRDIVLSLRETKAPVRIEPGSKNITLTRKLDREGIDGPSSVTFTVLCDKKNYNEPVRS